MERSSHGVDQQPCGKKENSFRKNQTRWHGFKSRWHRRNGQGALRGQKLYTLQRWQIRLPVAERHAFVFWVGRCREDRQRRSGVAFGKEANRDQRRREQRNNNYGGEIVFGVGR